MRLAPRKRVDLASILSASGWAKGYLEATRETYLNLLNDPRKRERLEACECPVCFYAMGRMGGAVSTSRQCGICQDLVHSCNTNVDAVCKACARAHELCAHCGGDIRMRVRRKFEGEVLPPLPLDLNSP